MRKYTSLIAIGFTLIIGINGCRYGVPPTPPSAETAPKVQEEVTTPAEGRPEEPFKSEPKLEQLTAAEVESHLWHDDLDFAGFKAAMKQSLRYYERVKPEVTFTYGEEKYSPQEMIHSLQLFSQVISDFRGEERIQKIQNKFLFFESKNEEEEAYFTGYYEPILKGSLIQTEVYNTPLYETPNDWIKVEVSLFEDLKGKKIIGKLRGNRLIPYDSRDEISYKNTLANRARPIVYVKNDIELFFLQIQGSGLVQLENEVLKRVNYASQNGHSYQSIGKLLIEEGIIPQEEMSLQSLKKYLYTNPHEVKRILNHNPSYTFFREVDEGPLGYIQVPLTPGRSLAMDRIVPRGGIAFVTTQEPVVYAGKIIRWKNLTRFMMVQDTGGAIRGHGRGDIFWGHGKESEVIAGHMSQRGHIFLLVAKKEFLQPSNDVVSQL